MSSIGQIVSGAIRWALILSATGGLGAATLYIAQEAAISSQTGLVSLTGLNRQLLQPRHRKVLSHLIKVQEKRILVPMSK